MIALIPQRQPGVLLTNSVVEICPRVLSDLARVLASVLLASARSRFCLPLLRLSASYSSTQLSVSAFLFSLASKSRLGFG